LAAGAAIYADECSACRGSDGKGAPYLFPSLAGSPNVRSVDPTSLIRVVIDGARSVATAGEPTGPGMPSFTWKLSDDQDPAPAVDASQVAQGRARLDGGYWALEIPSCASDQAALAF
jgi:mono/diheme cytochrome c family protein